MASCKDKTVQALRDVLTELNTVWMELDEEALKKAGAEHGIIRGKQAGISIATDALLNKLREVRSNG